jgi:predicted Zn-dependent protease
MRLGRIRAQQARGRSDAVELLDRAERLTRDRYVVYLARFFKGQYLERAGRPDDAERAYRGAVATVPHAQSATVALSTLLFQRERRAEAHSLTTAMLAARPQPVDPWRVYAHADDRFWPQLIARLRKDIAP